MKWITSEFPRLRINGVAEFVGGVFTSDDPVVIARMAAWVGRYGIEQTDDDPTPLPVNPFPQYPLEAELLDGSGRVLEGKLPARLSDVELRAALVPKWKPNTAYAAGEPVVNPSGQLVIANTSFTSGASYVAGNWTVTAGGGTVAGVAATVTTSGALAVNKHTPVDASGGAKTMTLPTGQAEGATISVEKADSSINQVSITGNLRGVTAQTLTLAWSRETVGFRADASGSWWPVVGHKTRTALDAAYESHPLEGVDVWVYGHSYTADPGLMCTPGLEFFRRVEKRLRLGTVKSYGVASSRMFEIAQDVLGTAVAGVAGSTWPGTASRKGVVALDGFFNDQNNGNVWTALGTQQRLDFQRALTLFLAVVGSASRVDDGAATKTGTWTANAFAPSSGGANQQTVVQGSTADFAVTVPAGVTTVYYVGYNVTSGPGVYTLSVDGTVVYDRATDSNGGTGALTTGRGSNISVQGYVVPIAVTPGARTIRVTKTDATTKPVFADAILIPSLTPPPVIVMRDGPTVVTGTHPQPQWDVFNANKAQIDAILDTVAAGFPNVIIADPGTMPANCFGADNVHPNDRGMKRLAGTVMAALSKVPETDQLYKTV